VSTDGGQTDDEYEAMETTLSATFFIVAKGSFPTIMTMIFFQLIQLISIYYVGQTDDPELLASVGLGCMILNVFCFAVAFGLNGTIESFVSREFGSGNYKECGAWLNRGRTIAIVVLIPTAICLFFADSILIFLK
jgi:multidrug resistance protein, MATE family